MRYVIAALTAFLFLPGWLSTSAYDTLGTRFDHTCITYSEGLGDAVRAWAAVSAIEDCGVSDTPDIELRIVEPWPYPEWMGASTAFEDEGRIAYALVEVPSSTTDADTLTHEVGHALGLKHSNDSNALMWWGCCPSMSSDDIAGIQSIYGTAAQRDALRGPYRLVVGGLILD